MKPCIALFFAIALAGCSRQAYVIGEERARADAAEQKRVARRDLAPSPMPKAEYAAGETILVNPSPVPLDAQLREVVRTYRASDAAKRASMRGSIDQDELYTLMTFANRSAAFGMRERDRSWIEDGLGAVAMIDLERVDERDPRMPIALLHHAAVRAGAEPAPMFEQAAALAQPRIAGQLRDFLSADADHKHLHSWLSEEVPTGFIGRGIADSYSPTVDLTSAIVGIASVIDADRYEVSTISIAEELPEVWIPGSAPLLRNVRGGATIWTGLENGVMVFLVEVPDAATANALRDASTKAKATRDTAIVGIARGNLFCLVVARAFTQGQTIDETPQTLQRFVTPVERILDGVL